MALGSDVGFYGGFGGGGGFGLPAGLFQPWQTGQSVQAGQYLGSSSYQPSLGNLLPATLGGFARQYIPELGDVRNLQGRLGSDLAEEFRSFRGGSEALSSGGIQGFTQNLLGNQNVQQLLREQELGREGTFLSGDGYEARGLGDLVNEMLGTEGSRLANIYGGLGLGGDEVTTDIQRFIQGEQSGLGALSARNLGGEGAGANYHTQGSREAVLQSLFQGQGLVDVGGQIFNPYSQDILGDLYNFQAGRAGAIQGNDIFSVLGGALSTQNLDITAGIQSGFGRAFDTGANRYFGGGSGYRLTEALSGMHGVGQLGENEFIGNEGKLGRAIDIWFGGLAGGQFGRGLPELIGRSIQTRSM